MEKKVFVQIIELLTTDQPRARAAALSEIETVFQHNTFESVIRDFPNPANSVSIAMLTLCIKRAEIWWEEATHG